MSDTSPFGHVPIDGNSLPDKSEDAASDELLPVVYNELRGLAERWLASEKPGQTLQPTALVHEALLRLKVHEGDRRWSDRAHFLSAAAIAMRRILIDNARRKNRLKYGGQLHRAFLESAQIAGQDDAEDKLDLLALDDALEEFESKYPDRAKVLHLRFFADLSYEEIAEINGIPARTAKRYWRFARSWLYKRLSTDDSVLKDPL